MKQKNPVPNLLIGYFSQVKKNCPEDKKWTIKDDSDLSPNQVGFYPVI
jgi:hypothetical protein